MNFFTTVVSFCLLVTALANPLELSEEQKVKAKLYFQECIKQENITQEDAIKLRNKDFTNPSHSIKCFGTCFFEKIGTLKDSVLQEEIVLQKLSAVKGEEKTKQILNKCRDIKGSDRCDTGFKIYECFESNMA